MGIAEAALIWMAIALSRQLAKISLAPLIIIFIVVAVVFHYGKGCLIAFDPKRSAVAIARR